MYYYIQNVWQNNGHKCYVCCEIEVPNMNKSNHFFSEISQHIKFMKNITKIWHRAKWYFTCVSNTWYINTVPNRNKIYSFFSAISHLHKMYEKLATITQIWQRAKYYKFYKHEQCIIPDNCTRYYKKYILLVDISQQTQKN